MDNRMFLKRISDLSIEKKLLEDRIKEIDSIQDEMIRLHFKRENPEVFR